MDNFSREAIQQKFFDLYMDATESAFIEVHLPEFGSTVMFSDRLNDSLKGKYIYPSNLLFKYQ